MVANKKPRKGIATLAFSGGSGFLISSSVANKKPRKGIATVLFHEGRDSLILGVANKKPRKGIATNKFPVMLAHRVTLRLQTKSPVRGLQRRISTSTLLKAP